MNPITVTLDRFSQRHGWANRLLRIDLTAGRISATPIDSYIPEFIGGRGVADAAWPGTSIQSLWIHSTRQVPSSS